MKNIISTALLFLSASWASAAPPGDYLWVDQDFGAVCNGDSTDPMNPPVNDQVALQNALDAVKSGGTLVFPPGAVCAHDDSLTVVNGSHFVIEGNGATLQNLAATAPFGLDTGGLDIRNSTHFEIRNLTLDGNRDGRGATPAQDPGGNRHMIFLRDASDGVFFNVKAVNSTKDGFYIKQNVTRIQFLGCTADNNYRHGLAVASGNDIQIIGGFYTHSNGTLNNKSERIGSGIRLESHEPFETISDVLISGVTIAENEGAGIHLVGDVNPTTNVRIVDNDLSHDQRGALRIIGSAEVIVRGNYFHDYALHADTQLGTVYIDSSSDIRFDGNAFDRIETGFHAAYVTGSPRVYLTGNTFRTINMEPANLGSGAAILHQGTDGIIAENRLAQCGYRGVWATGDRVIVRDNAFTEMFKNVIFVNATDAMITDNIVGPLSTAGGSAAAEAVIRSRADGGKVTGNAVVCGSSAQSGIVLDSHPALVSDNLITGCDPVNWIRFLAGQGSTVLVDNVQN